MKKKEIKLIKEKNFFQVLREKKSVKDFEEDGVSGIEIEWYASTKDKDRGHDIVDPQAFKLALDLYMTNPIVLLQHNMEKPIGVVTEAKIDENGLYIKARITQDVNGVISAIKNGVLRAFSIGYKIKSNEFLETEKEDGSRDYANVIKDLELLEISVVSVPMNAYSLMKSMQSCFEIKEVEAETEEKEVVAENAKITEEEKKADSEAQAETQEQEAPETEAETEEKDSEEQEQKALEPEAQKADEQSDIPEDAPEAQDQPENSAETAEDGQKKSIGSAEHLRDLQTKTIQNFISEEVKSMEQKCLTQLAEKDKQIEKLEKKLKNAVELLGDTIKVLWDLDNAVSNTVIKTWYTYQAPKQKQNSSKYSSLVKMLQDL